MLILPSKQIYQKKRQQIEQIMDKHEREFLRQISRQRNLLKNIRQRLSSQKEINSYLRTQNETSILTDLHKIENDINIRLGRAEIVIETMPVNFEELVMVGLKTYLSGTSSLYIKEMSAKIQPKKPATLRSTEEATRAYDSWLQVKKQAETMIARRELQSARQFTQYSQETRLIRDRKSKEAFDKWVDTKKAEGAFTKKQSSVHDNDTTQETNGT